MIGSNVEFLTKISESLQEAEKSKRPISVFERTFKDIRYQLVVKIRQIKAESKRTRLIDGFSLIFDLGEQAVESKEDVGLDVVMLQKKTSSTIRASIKKVMNFNKFKKMSQKSDDILSKEVIIVISHFSNQWIQRTLKFSETRSFQSTYQTRSQD